MDNKQESTFAEKHPQLNRLLGFFLLILLVGLAYFLLGFLWDNFRNLLRWIVQKADSVDAVIVVALITGGVSIFTVIFSSVIGKIIEYRQNRRDYLSQKRETPYGEFIEMVYKIQKNTRKEDTYTQQEMIEDISKFSKQLTLWGSKNVVEKWIKFREVATTPDQGAQNLFLLEDIMNEMRKDLGTKKTKRGNLLAFFINDIGNFVK